MLGEKITELKKDLIEYAGLVEGMIDKSIKGLLDKKEELLKEVIEKDEPKANQREVVLDETCINLIAQFQPAAGDLRKILMIYKINNDLERLADHAVNIAQSSLFLIERPQVKPLIDIPEMAKHANLMLRDSLNAFIREDVKLARAVCERDNTVDDFQSQIVRELITYMSSDAGTIERSLHLMRISNNLERIADLSTNICEDVIFMVEGKVIKHHQDER